MQTQGQRGPLVLAESRINATQRLVLVDEGGSYATAIDYAGSLVRVHRHHHYRGAAEEFTARAEARR